jgi:hypothetical protein
VIIMIRFVYPEAALPKELTSLSNWQTREISLVKRGANKKRRFPVYKQETTMDPQMIEVLKSLLDESIEDETKLDQWIEKKKLNDKEAAAVKGAVRLLNGFSDNASIKKALDSMANLFGPEKPNPKPEPPKEPAKKSDDPEPNPSPEPQAVPEAVQKALDDAKKETVELKKALADETRKRERTELVAKCKELYSHVPGLSTDEQADLLLDAGEEGAKQIEKQWAATEEAIVKSELLRAGGTGGYDASGGDAGRKLEQLARTMVEKSTDGLTYEAAYVKAMDQHPELYQQYMDENPKQTGR